MADEYQGPKPEQQPESESPNPNLKSSPSPPTMAFSSLSLNIWPPSQRTRDAVTTRLVETLTSSNSVLAKRYGVLDADSAAKLAAEIENAAFAFADQDERSGPNASAAVDGGLEILEIYSKEISKRMLESVKAKNSAGNAMTDPKVEAADLKVEEGADMAVRAEG